MPPSSPAPPLERAARGLIHADLDLRAYCLAFDEVLRRALPYGVAAWATHDPATGLTTSCTLSGLPTDARRESDIFRFEFRDDEPSTYLALIADGTTVSVLSEVTGGDLSRAGRYREVFRHFGMVDELRAILRLQGQVWGSLSLYRMDTEFTPADAATVEAVVPLVAEGMRLGLLRSAAGRPRAVQDPPGILEVDAHGQVAAATVPAHRWLEVGGERLRTAARVAAAALRERADWAGTTSRVVAADGRVLTLHAAHAVTDDGTMAVIVDAARPAEVAAMLVDAYQLTRRQREVLGWLLLGRSMTQIARQLDISEHTANDHRKAIYRRVGVSSRSELAALLQSEAYDPRTHRGAVPSPYGGFLADESAPGRVVPGAVGG